MASTIIDNYKIFPRLMMFVVTILTYQATHWFMSLPDPSNAQAGLVSVCMGALPGCAIPLKKKPRKKAKK